MVKKLLVLCFIFLIAISIAVVFVGNIWSKVFVSTANSSSSNGSTVISQELNEYFKQKKPFTILLLGYGGGKHEGAYLTDSLIVVTINPSQKSISLLSIPRDIWIDLPSGFNMGSHWKINAMYAIGLNDKDFPQKPDQYKGKAGGMNLSKYAVSHITGLTINKVVLVDFEGFKKGGDLLGGIDVTVEKAFDDFAYPIDGKENDPCGKNKQELDRLKYIELTSPAEIFPCRYEHLSFKQGSQRFDGATALKYVRSRHSAEEGTDFARSARQRAVLLAIKKKVENPLFVPKIVPLVITLSDYVKTDITISEMQTLLLYSKELKSYTVKNYALTNENFLKDGFTQEAGYVLFPKEGEDQWSTIQKWIQMSIIGQDKKKKLSLQKQNNSRIFSKKSG